MKRPVRSKTLAFAVAIALGASACRTEPELGRDAGASHAIASVDPGAVHVTVAPPAAAAAGVAPSVLVVDAPAEGSVDAIVRGALAAAQAAGRTLVVYVGATWCEPCQRFHQAAARGDLDAELPRLTLLDFDLDRDRERLVAAGYVSKYIPLFALPAPGGGASGKQIEGGVKGDGAVGFIVPRLKAMLAE
ncbi:MAG TPA: thioredoxin family protein [Polyangiaceae bacterium]|nr:thioredoxin family protein [Polyangiaceae bacterium]